MCEGSTLMEQPCPGGLTRKEELMVLLSRWEMGERKKEPAEKFMVSPITLVGNQ